MFSNQRLIYQITTIDIIENSTRRHYHCNTLQQKNLKEEVSNKEELKQRNAPDKEKSFIMASKNNEKHTMTNRVPSQVKPRQLSCRKRHLFSRRLISLKQEL